MPWVTAQTLRRQLGGGWERSVCSTFPRGCWHQGRRAAAERASPHVAPAADTEHDAMVLPVVAPLEAIWDRNNRTQTLTSPPPPMSTEPVSLMETLTVSPLFFL